MDLCTIDDLKSYLGLSTDPNYDGSEDSELSRLITATSAEFMREIRRFDFGPATNFTDRLVGSGDCELYLKHYPINSISDVRLYGDSLDESDGSSTGWLFDKDTANPENNQKIILIGSCFPRPCGERRYYQVANVEVDYNAGYAAAPADVSEAVIEWCAMKRGFSQLQAADQTEVTWSQIGSTQAGFSNAKSTQQASVITAPSNTLNAIARYSRGVL